MGESRSLKSLPEDPGIESFLDDDGAWLAIVVRHAFSPEGIHFFTPPEFSQQLGYMRHPAGHEVIPHRHNEVERKVMRTQEVLFLRRGRCRIDLYGDDERHVTSVTLDAGDWILLAGGGHGLHMLDECELFEVKQGPFVGESDKTRFQGV